MRGPREAKITEFVLRATQFGGNARLVPTAVMFPVALMRRGY